MHIHRLGLCLIENAQAAQCVTSQLVFDRLGDQRCRDNSSLLHGLHRLLWCCRSCRLLRSLLHCLHGGHGSKSRVLKASCRMQSELLEPTNNHTCTNKPHTKTKCMRATLRSLCVRDIFQSMSLFAFVTWNHGRHEGNEEGYEEVTVRRRAANVFHQMRVMHPMWTTQIFQKHWNLPEAFYRMTFVCVDLISRNLQI